MVHPERSAAIVDPRSLGWFPWMAWLTLAAGGGFLGMCDAAGEKLAWWLGITSPKYYYEIQEALRMKGSCNLARKKQLPEIF